MSAEPLGAEVAPIKPRGGPARGRGVMTDLAVPDPALLRQRLGLLTEEEVAAVAEVDDRTLQLWRTQRSGPPFTKIGRKVFYRLESLQRWLADREEETQP